MAFVPISSFQPPHFIIISISLKALICNRNYCLIEFSLDFLKTPINIHKWWIPIRRPIKTPMRRSIKTPNRFLVGVFGWHTCVCVHEAWPHLTWCVRTLLIFISRLWRGKFSAMGFSINPTNLRPTSETDLSLSNDTECNLPWEDFVETAETHVDIFILVCLLLTLIFDTFLIAIILIHDDLRKKARLSKWKVIISHSLFRGSTTSSSPSVSATCPLLST